MDAFEPELRYFLAEFDACSSRSEPRENLYRYLVGQLSQMERESIEPVARLVEGGEVRSMQRFICDVAWGEAGMIKKCPELVANDMGNPAAALIFDESGLAKRGRIPLEWPNSIAPL